MTKTRTLVASLTLSAAALVASAVTEFWSDTAIIPVPGDRPTYGYGSTFKEDGSPVKMGETIDPVRGLRLKLLHYQKAEVRIKQCIGPDVLLYQAEYDVYARLANNIGEHNFCTGGKSGQTSSIVKNLRAGNYVAACNGILDWKYYQKFDCSTPGNKLCGGVWKNRLELHAECMGAQ